MEKRMYLLCFILFLAFWGGISPSLASPSQNSIRIEAKNENLSSVLKRLENVSGYKMMYAKEDVTGKRVSASVSTSSVKKALNQILEGTGLTYTIDRQFVTIKKRTAPFTPKKTGNDPITVTGQVFDENGEGILGVTVMVEGTGRGTTTNGDGRYTITADPGQRLSFSYYIGYKTTTVRVTSSNRNKPINIHLDVDSKALGEVVVNGIYTRKAESYTGSAVTITGSDLKRVGNGNLLQSLKSIEPSVYIADNLTSGSDPNNLPSVSIRGTSSFPAETSSLKSNYQHDPNSPLWILDGFETTVEHVMDLDMNRVQSVTVLKDASAKALYGSKAANGVIVIETKRLGGNETRVTYNGSLDLEMADLSSYDMCNAAEKLQVEKYEGVYTASNNDAAEQKRLDDLYNQRLVNVLNGQTTDWLAKPLHTGVGQKHNINVELGDSRSLRAILDFTYNDISGVMRDSYRRNIMGSASISYRHKNLLFRDILEVYSNHSQDSPYGSFSDYVKMNPYWMAEDENGKILRYADYISSSNTYVANPLYDATIGTSLKSSYSQITNNFYTEWSFLHDWRATLRIGVMHKRNDADSFYPAKHSRFISYIGDSDARKHMGQYIMENGKSSEASGDLNINYNHAFGRNHVFANAGYFVSESRYQAYQVTTEGFANNTKADATFAQQYLENSVPSGYASVNREMSFLMAASYDYDNRYLTDFTVRESASSLYGSDKRWANSWSLGLGWNVHNEPFMKNCKWLRQLKIRGSYGLTGNQNFNTNEAIATYRYYSGYNYKGYSGAYLVNMPNSELMWEQKKDWNVGVDFGAGPLTLTFDWYSADTKNMLTSVTIPTSTGFSSVKDNLGLVRNSGVELKASLTPWKNKDGFVNLYGSFVYTKNKIIHLSESMREYNERMLKLAEQTSQSTPVLMYQDGLSMNTIWAVPSAGIDPQTGREIYIKKDGTLTYDYSSDDMVAAGDATPKYRGTGGFTAEYEGIGLTMTLVYLAGGQMYNQTLVDRVEDADIAYNVDRRVLLGRWNHPGQVTKYKGYSSSEMTRATTRFVQDRNELSISSISAYYEFPKSIYSKLMLQRLRFAVYLNNVATFSSIKVERGTSYPFARTLSFALTATF